jgi:hypothetical protein
VPFACYYNGLQHVAIMAICSSGYQQNNRPEGTILHIPSIFILLMSACANLY